MQQCDCQPLHEPQCSGGRGVREKRAAAGTDNPRDWWVIATGPSLTVEDAQKAWQTAKERDGRIIVINDNYRHPALTGADYLYACDEAWWKIHLDRIREVFKGELWTQFHNDSAKKFAVENGINVIPGKGGSGLGNGFVHHGSNSGHQAICLAHHLSTKVFNETPNIYLLGFDMGATGQTHWFGNHPKQLCNGNHKNFVPQFTKLAQDLKESGIKCVNLTRETLLTQFARSTIDDWDFHSIQ